MKKATMIAVVNYLTNNLSYADENEKEFLQTTIDELNAELSKGEAKAQANRDLYAQAHDVIMNALPIDTPVTIAELYEEVAENLPDGMTKGKVQHAITRMWVDEVVKHEGKTNGYTRKV